MRIILSRSVRYHVPDKLVKQPPIYETNRVECKPEPCGQQGIICEVVDRLIVTRKRIVEIWYVKTLGGLVISSNMLNLCAVWNINIFFF